MTEIKRLFKELYAYIERNEVGNYSSRGIVRELEDAVNLALKAKECALSDIEQDLLEESR